MLEKRELAGKSVSVWRTRTLSIRRICRIPDSACHRHPSLAGSSGPIRRGRKGSSIDPDCRRSPFERVRPTTDLATAPSRSNSPRCQRPIRYRCLFRDSFRAPGPCWASGSEQDPSQPRGRGRAPHRLGRHRSPRSGSGRSPRFSGRTGTRYRRLVGRRRPRRSRHHSCPVPRVHRLPRRSEPGIDLKHTSGHWTDGTRHGPPRRRRRSRLAPECPHVFRAAASFAPSFSNDRLARIRQSRRHRRRLVIRRYRDAHVRTKATAAGASKVVSRRVDNPSASRWVPRGDVGRSVTVEVCEHRHDVLTEILPVVDEQLQSTWRGLGIKFWRRVRFRSGRQLRFWIERPVSFEVGRRAGSGPGVGSGSDSGSGSGSGLGSGVGGSAVATPDTSLEGALTTPSAVERTIMYTSERPPGC